MGLLPYNHAADLVEPLGTASCGDPSIERNPSRFDALGHPVDGRLAQPVVALPLHGRCRGFESLTAHHPAVEIQLTKGYVALISPEDYDRVSIHKWCAAVQQRKDGSLRVYAKRGVQREDGRIETILLHRVIADAAAGELVDHRDRNSLDCRRHNVRKGTQHNNCCNKIQRTSKHGFIGVDSQTDGSYRGRVSAHRVAYYTKTFPCPILAAAARDVLAQQHHGAFAVLNFQFTPLL